MPIPGLFTNNVRKRTVRNCKQNLKQKSTLSNHVLTIIHLLHCNFLRVLCTQNAFCCNVFHKIRVAGRLTKQKFFGDAISRHQDGTFIFTSETLSVSRTSISNFWGKGRRSSVTCRRFEKLGNWMTCFCYWIISTVMFFVVVGGMFVFGTCAFKLKTVIYTFYINPTLLRRKVVRCLAIRFPTTFTY